MNMKAIVIDRFGGPDVLQYRDIPIPVPEKGQVLVKNVAINVGKPDALVRSGLYPYLKGRLPGMVIGNECSGYVEAVGQGVSGFTPGMPVLVTHPAGYGAYAEYICVDEKFVTPLPRQIPPQKAAGLTFFEIAYALLHDAGRSTVGKTLYIMGGAGGLGTALIKMAMHDGWTVISSADTQEKCDYLRSIGTACVFDCQHDSAKEVIMAFTKGRGVDLVFDQLVGKGFFNQFELLADFGTLVVYNWLEGSPGVDFFPSLVSQAAHCTAVRPFSFHIYDNYPNRRAEIQNAVFDLVGSGAIEQKFFHDPWPLSKAAEAHKLLDSGMILGKMILDPTK